MNDDFRAYKRCQDCRWYAHRPYDPHNEFRCTNPEVCASTAAAMTADIPRSVPTTRARAHYCGIEASYFEPKPAQGEPPAGSAAAALAAGIAAPRPWWKFWGRRP